MPKEPINRGGFTLERSEGPPQNGTVPRCKAKNPPHPLALGPSGSLKDILDYAPRRGHPLTGWGVTAARFRTSRDS